MKKTPRKAARHTLSLGDLISTISACSKNSQETIAAVADLLDSGRVRLRINGRKLRARVF